MEDKIKELYNLIQKSNYTVFFGGAGVSTGSGIPDFRSDDGLYNKIGEKFKRFEPEFYLSKTCLLKYPKDFFEFVRYIRDTREYQPNITHKVLAKLEEKGKLQTVITQNIDNLHQRAGSKNVLEIHGNSRECHCEKCKMKYPDYYVFDNKDEIPKCFCGGYIRPSVTLYEEELPEVTLLKAIVEIRKAELLIIGGTSLTVAPASNIISFFEGKEIVIINNFKIDYQNSKTALYIEDNICKVFEELEKLMD